LAPALLANIILGGQVPILQWQNTLAYYDKAKTVRLLIFTLSLQGPIL